MQRRFNNRGKFGQKRFGRPGQRPQSSTQTRDKDIISPKRTLDINCNVGQGFGIYQNQFEEKIIPHVTSINIACGAHAGDPLTMARSIDVAKNHQVSVGALIGYNDIAGNGEREMYLGVDEIRALVLYQLGALNGLVHAKGLEISHVRAHGFLYKQLYTDLLIAETVAKAIGEFSKWITLVGLSGPIIQAATTNANIKCAQEVQVARRYRRDGTILPFSQSIDGKNFVVEAGKRVRELIQTGSITCEDKSKMKANVDTIHVPSDNSDSIELAQMVKAMVPNPKPLNTDKYEKFAAGLAALL